MFVTDGKAGAVAPRSSSSACGILLRARGLYPILTSGGVGLQRFLKIEFPLLQSFFVTCAKMQEQWQYNARIGANKLCEIVQFLHYTRLEQFQEIVKLNPVSRDIFMEGLGGIVKRRG